MSLGEKHGLAFALRHPRTTVRWRLTLLYGALFLASGAGLLAITYTLVDHATLTNAPFRQAIVRARRPLRLPDRRGPNPSPHFTSSDQVGPPGLPIQVRKLLRSQPGRAVVAFVGSTQRIADLHQLEVESVIALVIMAVISAGLGWLVAGRVLRPLRTMTATTQQISEVNLDRRLAMPGPRDELRQLGDTIDGLLERLGEAFDAQRRFVANASHELRTPLTTARALLELVMSDPDATLRTFRETCRQVLEEGEQQEQLIDALLTLAHGQRAIDHPERFDLAAITREVLRTHETDAAQRGLHLDVLLDGAPVDGDPRLIERLVSNLLENALRHNAPDGHVEVRVRTRGGEATLKIANTGPLVPAGEVERLLRPFQRLVPDRVGPRDGLGLGLSIVAAIANAHNAALDIQSGARGGLDIEVRFPHVLHDGDVAGLPPGDAAPRDT